LSSLFHSSSMQFGKLTSSCDWWRILIKHYFRILKDYFLFSCFFIIYSVILIKSLLKSERGCFCVCGCLCVLSNKIKTIKELEVGRKVKVPISFNKTKSNTKIKYRLKWINILPFNNIPTSHSKNLSCRSCWFLLIWG